MAIVRWDPFREFATIQARLNRVLGADYDRTTGDDVMNRGAWLPPVDIYSNGNHELIIKAEIPDMKKDNIDVIVENNTLTIRGEKKVAENVTEEQFHRVERSYGTVARSCSLPNTVDPNKVQADYKDGVLTIVLPLREESKPKQIKVNVAA
jgi:HSP20 family protein